jgi:hypothetical protein
MNMKSTRDIVTALGGTKYVADKICVDPHIVDNWLQPERRIGAVYWLDILELARRQKLSWITPQLLRKARGCYSTGRPQRESV